MNWRFSLYILFFVFCIHCKKDSANIIATLQLELVSNEWEIDTLQSEQNDVSSQLRDYIISFSANGHIQCVKGLITTEGPFTLKQNNGHIEFSIYLGETLPCGYLSGVWTYDQRSTNFKKFVRSNSNGGLQNSLKISKIN